MTATPRAPAPAPPPVQVFVFDDRLGQKEGDELSKILARFPSRVPDDALASDLGLVEGVARFASYFVARRKSSSDASASSSSSSSSRASLFETKTQTIRSRRRRVTCASFEPNLWWTLAIDDRVAPADEIRDAALVELLARANESHVLTRGDRATADSLAAIVADLGASLTPSEAGSSPRTGGGFVGGRRAVGRAESAGAADDAAAPSRRATAVSALFACAVDGLDGACAAIAGPGAESSSSSSRRAWLTAQGCADAIAAAGADAGAGGAVKGVVLFHGDALAFSSFSASDTRRMTRVIRRALLAEGGGDAEARAKATRAEAARGVEACGGGGGGGGGASWPFMDGEWRAVASSSSPPPPLPMHLADGVVDAFAVLPPSGDAVAVVALARGGAADANEGENETARLRDAVAAAASPRLVDLHAALSYSPTAETTTRGGADADADADADATCEPRERHVYAFRDPASATRVGSSRERRVEGTSASALRTLDHVRDDWDHPASDAAPISEACARGSDDRWVYATRTTTTKEDAAAAAEERGLFVVLDKTLAGETLLEAAAEAKKFAASATFRGAFRRRHG